MKKTLRKTLSAILTLALITGLFAAMPITAHAANSVNWTQNPQSQTVTEGQTATFTVRGIASWEPIMLSPDNPNGDNNFNMLNADDRCWTYGENFYDVYLNDTYIVHNGGTIASGQTLTFTATREFDGVIFCYWVWDGSRWYYSNEATLTVNPAPPTITQQPQDKTVSQGGTATFTVDAIASGTLAYQWYVVPSGGYSGTAITDGSIYSGAKTKTLTITNSNLAFGVHSYYCSVTNVWSGDSASNTPAKTSAAIASSSAKLTVSPPPPPTAAPTIIIHPSDRSITAGQDTTFEIAASGGASQWQCRPYYGSTAFSAWENVSDGGIYSGANERTLVLTNVPASYNNYQYRCVLTNTNSGAAATSSAATLTVSESGGDAIIGIAPTPPLAPSELTFEQSPVGLILRWIDNSDNEFGFFVERKDYGGDNWTELHSGQFYVIGSGTVDANVTTYTDNTAQEGKVYVYRVRAYRGTTPYQSFSNYSNEVTATMTAAPTTFTVTFNSNNGSAVASQTVATGGKATKPADPTRTGYTFDGWYSDSGLTNAYDFNAVVTANITLYAKWNVASVTTPDTGSMANFLQKNTYTSGMFNDVNNSHWYESNVAIAYEYGLMQGSSATTFNPTGNMTLAEALTIAARVNDIYKGGSGEFTQGSVWYQVYVDYAIANGIIVAGDFSSYTSAATRAEMAYIFSRSIPASEFAVQNTVNSLPDVNSDTPYSAAILTLYRAGVLTGNNAQGSFSPGNNITRAEAAAIISRVILPSSRATGNVFG